MGRILFLTNIDRQHAMMARATGELVTEGLLTREEACVLSLSGMERWTEEWRREMSGCDIVLLSWMGAGRDTDFLRKATAFLRSQQIIHTILATDPDPEDTLYGVTPAGREMMRSYLLYSGLSNYRNFWLWLAGEYGGRAVEYQPPQPLLWNGIFHPCAGKAYTDVEAYFRHFCREGRPTVGLLFPRDEWIWADLAYQTALVEEIERQGMNAVAVFSHWARTEELNAPGVEDAVQAYFYRDGKPAVDVVLNNIKFSLTVGRPGDPEFLHRLGVPVLQTYGLLRPGGDWLESVEGLTPMEVSISVAMPEFDGAIHAVPVAAKEHLDDGTIRYTPLPERIERAVSKARKWAVLRRKPNHEKKIAIVFHNYPPDNASIGSAQGMDSPESVRWLLGLMAAEGYQVGEIPADSREFMELLTDSATNDRRFLSEAQIAGAAGRVTAGDYRRLFAGLPEVNRHQLEKDWGTPPGDVFCYEDALLVPGRLSGNVFITVQPPRGFGEDPGKLLHSPDCAPTHHYIAYYHWLRDIWQADAVVHVGTHGSLEWLPGKGSGLSCRCYPDIALGDLPNIYPYLITIVGEGTQAKRRSAACMIGHLPPPMDRAETYDELSELEKLLDEYIHFAASAPANVPVVSAMIREKALAMNLADDLPGAALLSDDEYVQKLHGYITDLKNMQIRVGLHILGQPPAEGVLVNYLLALTRLDNGEVPSLPDTVALGCGLCYQELFASSGKILAGGKTGGMLIEEVHERCREFVTFLWERDFSEEGLANVLPELSWAAAMPDELRQRLTATAEYICRTLAPNLAKTAQETGNLLAGLAGRFVEPGPAGAPTSGMADILPTGRNFYGVDPRLLPTPAAWELGKMLGDSVIEQYVAEEGRYPENIGIIMWSGANMRSRGQCIAQFLYILGVRPVWQKGSQRVVGLEVMTPEELKRPRIDVTARISGLFRDALPPAVKWLDAAVALVAALDEDGKINYVRKHALEDARQLAAAGAPKEAAWEQACYRIFGCPPGTYGAGVGSMLEEKNWETVDDLARVYVRWGAHAYGKKTAGAYVPELFSRRLSQLDVTVKNEDNREVHMLNSDDFNAYHGGMIAAVRSLKGKAPRSYCGDSSDRRQPVVRGLKEEVKRLFRGEVMNPKYIQGMQKHGYKGAADLAGIVAHCYDWDATSGVMEDWMYDGLAQKYALDQQMRDWMTDVNPWALRRIAEKLLEASQRGLWQAGEETLRDLRDLYLGIDGELEERSE